MSKVDQAGLIGGIFAALCVFVIAVIFGLFDKPKHMKQLRLPHPRYAVPRTAPRPPPPYVVPPGPLPLAIRPVWAPPVPGPVPVALLSCEVAHG
jgi:hypothetical protein